MLIGIAVLGCLPTALISLGMIILGNPNGSGQPNNPVYDLTNTAVAATFVAPTSAAVALPTEPAVVVPTLIQQENTAAPVATEGNIIQIAVLTSKSDLNQDPGSSTVNGVQMAADQSNTKGAIIGKEIRVVNFNVACDEQAVTAALQNAQASGIHYVIGSICATASFGVNDVIDQEGMLMISTQPDGRLHSEGLDYPDVYWIGFSDEYQGQAAAELIGMIKAQKVSVLFDPSNMDGGAQAEAFIETVAKQNHNLLPMAHSPGQADYSADLDTIAQFKPDAIYLPVNYDQANSIIQQARQKGITATFIGADGWDAAGLDKTVTEGSYYTTQFTSDSPSAQVQTWVNAYQARFGLPPDAAAALAYDFGQCAAGCHWARRAGRPLLSYQCAFDYLIRRRYGADPF